MTAGLDARIVTHLLIARCASLDRVRKRLVAETRRQVLWALGRDVADGVKDMIAIVAMGLSARVVEGGLCLGACTSGECRAGSPVGAAARTAVDHASSSPPEGVAPLGGDQ
jgi:hypothetical protein